MPLRQRFSTWSSASCSGSCATARHAEQAAAKLARLCASSFSATLQSRSAGRESNAGGSSASAFTSMFSGRARRASLGRRARFRCRVRYKKFGARISRERIRNGPHWRETREETCVVRQPESISLEACRSPCPRLEHTLLRSVEELTVVVDHLLRLRVRVRVVRVRVVRVRVRIRVRVKGEGKELGLGLG